MSAFGFQTGSIKAVRRTGLLLGAVITFCLLLSVLHDRVDRREVAQRRSLALATSADRLLQYELRNLERTLRGIASTNEELQRGIPERARAVLSQTMTDLLIRHPELTSVALLDEGGRALTPGPDDPGVGGWQGAKSEFGDLARIGPLQRDTSGTWVLPLAVRSDHSGWVVARLEASEIQRMMTGMDRGRDGSIGVFDRNGVLVARSPSVESFIGRRVVPADILKLSAEPVQRNLVSSLDGVERYATFRSSSGYALTSYAGIGVNEALGAWNLYAIAAASLCVLYWLSFGYLLRLTTHSERVRDATLTELRANAERLSEAHRVSRSGTWLMIPDEARLECAGQVSQLLGFPPGTSGLTIDQFLDVVHRDDRARVAATFKRREGGEALYMEYRVVMPDGEVRWMSSRGAPFTDTRGRRRVAGTLFDITERMEAQTRIQQAEFQFRQTFERNPLPFWVHDEETRRIVAVNEAAIASYGFSREQFLAMRIEDLVAKGGDAASEMSMPANDDDDERIWQHRTRDGRIIEVLVQGSEIDFAGRRARLVLGQDISDRVAYERDLAFRASYDPTTHLPTVPALATELDAAMHRAGPHSACAVIYAQLRDLELIAPTLGRRASDEILRAVAGRFDALGRQYGFAAYVPGGTFVLATLDAKGADRMIADLELAMERPIEWHGTSHALEAWIGLACGPDDGRQAELLIGNAALASLQARKDNVPYVKFDTAMAGRASERLAMTVRIRHALERREFELHFQPILRVADNRLMAVEALVRWPQADGSFISPGQFIPLCEESGLIVPLGAWVAEEAARCHGVFARHGHASVSIAINVSAVQFLHSELPADLRRLRETYRLPDGALQVELTESALLKNPDTAMVTMRQLRDDGVGISLDDFGTGFSSMAYLKDLPLDYIKIDRAFVADVDRHERSAAICRALIALGHSLGLTIIAEGVEHAAQYEWLRAHGCDHAQGYFLGRAVPLAQLLEDTRLSA